MKLYNFISKRFWHSENQKFINFAKYFATASVIIGVVVLIIALAVLEGYNKTLRANAVKFTSHIQLQKFNRDKIDNYDSIKQVLYEHISEINIIEPVIQTEALIKSKKNIEGVMLRGIEKNSQIVNLSDVIKIGKADINQPNSIIIGKRLADKLSTKLGDTVFVFSINSFQNLSQFDYNIQKFVITGIFESTMAQYDDAIAFVSINDAQNLLNLFQNQATNLDIMLKDISLADTTSHLIDNFLSYPYFTYTVFDLHRSIFSWIELQQKPIPIVLGLIVIIAVLNITTTLLILIIEKINEIGILRALGLLQKEIIRIFVRLGLKIGIIGAFTGGVIAFLISILQKEFEIIRVNGEIYYLDVLPIEIVPLHYVIVISIAIILSFLATLIPAVISSRISPLEAIKFK
ncbi:MAG TPA: ABC transporter permease [Candidatus Kapabacteria bacterium]|nr:ABC transporter permease [Candidatus Kapabacteria bacterium]